MELEGKTSTENVEEGGNGGDNNFFDFLVSSTIKTLNNRDRHNTSFSSLQSAASTASRRRNRPLRVKRYTDEGDEVSTDTADIPESASSHVGGFERAGSISSFSSLNASGRSFQRPYDVGAANRSGRIKRYQTAELRPSTISSSGSESGSDNEDDGKNNAVASHPAVSVDLQASASSSPADEHVSNIPETSQDHDESHHMSEAGSEAESSKQSTPSAAAVRDVEKFIKEKSGVNGSTPSYAEYAAQIEQIERTMKSRQKKGRDIGRPAETATAQLEVPIDENDTSMDTVTNDYAGNPPTPALQREMSSSSARNMGLAVSVRVDDGSGDDSEPEEADVVASSHRAQESILKRKASALAIAAAAQYSARRSSEGDGSSELRSTGRSRKVQLTTVDEAGHSRDRSSLVYNAKSPKEAEKIKLSRVEELEQRKRKLEALAQATSIRKDSQSSVNMAASSSSFRHKSARNGGRQRAVNVDVYTGEVIGEMPRISSVVREEGLAKDDIELESSSDYSSTEYDLPATKRQKQRRMLLILLVLIGIGLGVYFGVYYHKGGGNKGRANPLIKDTLVPSPGPPNAIGGSNPTVAPSSLLRRTYQPSLEPSAISGSNPLPSPIVSSSGLFFSDTLYPSAISTTENATLLPSNRHFEASAEPSAAVISKHPNQGQTTAFSSKPSGNAQLTNNATASQTVIEPSASPSNKVPATGVPTTQPPATFSASEAPTQLALRAFLSKEWPPLTVSLVRDSPQLKALEWLSSDPGLSSYSDARNKQRFALATFFYSTGGRNWSENGRWLSNDNECSWFTSGASLQCNQNGMYTSLSLNFNGLNGTLPGRVGPSVRQFEHD